MNVKTDWLFVLFQVIHNCISIHFASNLMSFSTNDPAIIAFFRPKKAQVLGNLWRKMDISGIENLEVLKLRILDYAFRILKAYNYIQETKILSIKYSESCRNTWKSGWCVWAGESTRGKWKWHVRVSLLNVFTGRKAEKRWIYRVYYTFL